MRTNRFTFLCTTEERKMITVLARFFQRSQGDTIRYLIRVAVLELQNKPDEFNRVDNQPRRENNA